MSATGDASSEVGLDKDAEPLVPELGDQLKAAGLDTTKVDEFMGLLSKCSVHTRGALRLFASSLGSVTEILYDTATPLGKIQAKGFLAAVQVWHAHSNSCPLEKPQMSRAFECFSALTGCGSASFGIARRTAPR